MQIKYDLPEASHVQLFIYDILELEVTSLVNEVQEPGYRSITWHSTDAFVGFFVCRFKPGL